MKTTCFLLVSGLILFLTAPRALAQETVTKWRPLTLDFSGPLHSQGASEPNPFLDYRLQVTFMSPRGESFQVPGYFAGDGSGGGSGNVWRVRFSPDETGQWSYRVSFRKGAGVAVNGTSGEAVDFDGQEGQFTVSDLDSNAPGFYKWGRLNYVGEHYLKFEDGPYWIKGGTDSPENFLAYAGFQNTPSSHRFSEHLKHWKPGDPDWSDGKGKAIIGALNYLAEMQVNSIYFLTMNIGGDGKDVWPWHGSPEPSGSSQNDRLHYDIGKLDQWETVFAHAQAQGIFLHFVLNEAEEANKKELDSGELGIERKLYYRELVARFAHHLALQWNLSEEFNLDFNLQPKRVRQFAGYLKDLDPYNHPITVHSAGDPLEMLRFTFGDELFSMTSIQANQRDLGQVVEAFREATAAAGRPLPIAADEFTVDIGQEQSWVPFDDAEKQRREKLWPVYLSGGIIEFILEGFLELESFATTEREQLWRYTWFARKFLEGLPFWEMEPADHLLSGEATIQVGLGAGRSFQQDGEVFAKRGEIYAVYLPDASSGGKLDLSDTSQSLRLRWYNPRTGEFRGETTNVDAGGVFSLGLPPEDTHQDWVALIQ